MLRIAERKRLINATPFREAEMLEERKERRQPHILTFQEEKRLLAAATDLIRVLAILILDTGLRSGREALALKWDDIDFSDEAIRIRQSKTPAGVRSVPISVRCKAELLKWRKQGADIVMQSSEVLVRNMSGKPTLSGLEKLRSHK